MSTIDQKLRRVFPDEVVNKRLSRTHQLDRLPKFISEYAAKELVGESEDPSSMSVLSNFVKQFYPEPKDKDRVLHEIMTRGEYTLLDEFKVRVDPRRGLRRVEIPSLQIRDAMIIPSILEQYKELLETGMWGTAKLSWQPMILEEVPVPQTPIIITSFEPLQYSNVRVDDYKIRRSEFSLHEWIDALMQTLGMNPEAYDDRTKLIYISRDATLNQGYYCLFDIERKKIVMEETWNDGADVWERIAEKIGKTSPAPEKPGFQRQ